MKFKRNFTALVLAAVVAFTAFAGNVGVLAEVLPASVVEQGNFYAPGDVPFGTRSGAAWVLDSDGVVTVEGC